MFSKWPHEFLELDVFQQNLAVLCAADSDAAMAMAVKGAVPTFDIADVV